jgi:uncharacterized phiE125 gp8 family phage protein
VSEPLSLSDAKGQCRALADVAEEDGLISLYLSAGRQIAEQYTGRGFLTQTWKLEQDAFTDPIWLPWAAPLQSVTSVKYFDENGTQQTLATTVYRVDTTSQPGRVVLKPNQSWPSVQVSRGQSVEVIYVTGWTSAEVMPADVRIAVGMLADHLYENRGAVQVGVGIGAVEVPFGPAALLSPYLVIWPPPVR